MGVQEGEERGEERRERKKQGGLGSDRRLRSKTRAIRWGRRLFVVIAGSCKPFRAHRSTRSEQNNAAAPSGREDSDRKGTEALGRRCVSRESGVGGGQISVLKLLLPHPSHTPFQNELYAASAQKHKQCQEESESERRKIQRCVPWRTSRRREKEKDSFVDRAAAAIRGKADRRRWVRPLSASSSAPPTRVTTRAGAAGLSYLEELDHFGARKETEQGLCGEQKPLNKKRKRCEKGERARERESGRGGKKKLDCDTRSLTLLV